MDIGKRYLLKLLSSRGFDTSKTKEEDLRAFISNDEIETSIQSIFKLQEQIMEKWKIKASILDFNNLSLFIPNGKENIDYHYSFEKEFLSNNKITHLEFSELENIGLEYNEENLSIKGTPTGSGNFKLKILFKVIGELENTPLNEKLINFVINPDPKSLWKDIPSDKDAIYWKEDNFSTSGQLKDKSIVISSKRGRSHQNVGSFRDDHAEYKSFKETGWTVVAVSDGAGSATLSRKGSELACKEVINYFENHLTEEELTSFEDKINQFRETKDEVVLEQAKNEGIRAIYKASVRAFTEIEKIADQTFIENPELKNNPKARVNTDYFHATLIFTAFKKFDIGYVFLSFSVGDCPIGIVNKEGTNAKLLNWLDVGEFGGGTRFLTQREIFSSKEREITTRFNFHVQQDFSYLFLMTDGIYDAKFMVEANLDKTEKWLEFIDDLKGNNEEKKSINFGDELSQVETELSEWMDFWSKGNHDDRTLAIVY